MHSMVLVYVQKLVRRYWSTCTPIPFGKKKLCQVYKSTNTSTSFPEERPEALVELQTKYWKPVLDWARSKHGVEIKSFESVFETSQPQETIKHFNNVLLEMDKWTLAGKVHRTYIIQSLINVSDGTWYLCNKVIPYFSCSRGRRDHRGAGSRRKSSGSVESDQKMGRGRR